MEKLLALRGLNNSNDVHAADCDELCTADFEGILETARARNKSHILIVYSKLLVTSKKISIYKSLCALELFERSRLLILLAGHRFMVPHICLDAEERANICRLYGEANLPCLLDTDPVARLYGFKIGDIILIRRPQVYFRRVVPA